MSSKSHYLQMLKRTSCTTNRLTALTYQTYCTRHQFSVEYCIIWPKVSKM